MNKFFIVLLLLFSSILLHAQSSSPYVLQDRDNDETENNLEVPSYNSRENNKRRYKEDTLFYYKFGQTVPRFNNEKNITMNSLGFKRYSVNFFYGLEHNVYSSKSEEIKASAVQGLVGYRMIWNHRFLPYAVFQAGSASFSDKTKTIPSASGIASTLDFGLDFIKYNKIKLATGIRHSSYIFNSSVLKKADFTDLYLSVGLEF